MSFFNPMRLIIIPFLSLVTLPLAVFAGITTILAFSVLLFRVSLVYVNLLTSFLLSYIFSRDCPHSRHLRYASRPPSVAAGPASIGEPATPAGSIWGRRTSVASAAAEFTTPLTERGLGLPPSAGLDRDFEGLGGWRTSGDDDDDEDELWTRMNLRPDRPRRHHSGKGHHRALTWGPAAAAAVMDEEIGSRARTRSPCATRKGISPNSARIRSPPIADSASGSSTGLSRPSLSARLTS